jgi:hypothetical protein
MYRGVRHRLPVAMHLQGINGRRTIDGEMKWKQQSTRYFVCR